jgi:TonB family protein
MLPQISGADLLRSERTTQEFVALGEAASHVLSQWGAERLGVVVDPAAVPRDENVPDCTGRVPSIHSGAHRVKQADAKPVEYPLFDQMEGRESDTIVAILVGRSGKVCRAKVVDSINGSVQTNRWALQQAQSWTFEAPRIEGQPVESIYMVRLQARFTD